MQKQYGFLAICKNLVMRSLRERALSKVIPLTSGKDSGATAPMSTLFICSSSCADNLTVKPPSFRLRNASRCPVGKRKKAAPQKCRPLACPHIGTHCLEVNTARFRNDAGPRLKTRSQTHNGAPEQHAGCPRGKNRSFPSHTSHIPGRRYCSTARPA